MADILIGTDGNDDLNATDSVFQIDARGGADKIHLTLEQLDAFKVGSSTFSEAYIDGGEGVDTLSIASDGDLFLRLDDFVDAGSNTAFRNIERIEIAGATSSILQLSLKSVLAIGQAETAQGSGGTSASQVVKLSISAVSGGTVQFSDSGWALQAAKVQQDGVTYRVYSHLGAAVSVLVADDMDAERVNLPLQEVAAGHGGFVMIGECATDNLGWDVAAAGDVNGDGLADLIVGTRDGRASYSSAYVKSDKNAYVVFGKADGTAVQMSDVVKGDGGFALKSANTTDSNGLIVSSGGDVNGDGLADLIVGVASNDNSGTDAGRTYVVFGKTSGTAVSLSSLGTGGFAIAGQCAGDLSGAAVSAAGDVNGDGLDDFIIGAYRNDIGGSNAGRAYVVFGKTDGAEVKLSAVSAGTGGFALRGDGKDGLLGYSVAGVGDLNGDGLGDILVSAPHKDSDGLLTGVSYVVFGKAGGSEVRMDSLGGAGYKISGYHAYGAAGYEVSGVGDVNGDGLNDLFIGGAAHSYVVFGKTDNSDFKLSALAEGNGGFIIFNGVGHANNSYQSAGDFNGDGLSDLLVSKSEDGVFVVFGKSDGSSVNLNSLGAGGFKVVGEDGRNLTGSSVSFAGDVNGDGLSDLIVGAYQNDAAGDSAGRAYVVFGKSDGAEVKLSAVATGDGGFAITGECAGDLAGYSVSAAGDVNGDGLDDLIVGAYGNDAQGSNSGRSYVIFGRMDGEFDRNDLDIVGTNSSEWLRDGGVARHLYALGGDDMIEVSANGTRVSAGSGDDIIIISEDVLAGLMTHSGTHIAGGDGADMLSFDGFGITVDLDTLNMGQLTGIEHLEIGGNLMKGSQASFAKFGIVDGFEANGRQQLRILGTADASIDLSDGEWTLVASHVTTDLNGGYFDVYNASESNLSLYVSEGVRITGLPLPVILGTDDADVLSDDGIAKHILAMGGDDTITLSAAGSIVDAGTGDDLISISPEMVASLQSDHSASNEYGEPVLVSTGGRLIAGGEGTDTLVINGDGVAFDLSEAVTQGNLSGIEILDLSGSGANSVSLKIEDAINPNSLDIFGSDGRFEFMISGDMDDAVTLNGGDQLELIANGFVAENGRTFDVWDNGSSRLYIEEGVQVTTVI